MKIEIKQTKVNKATILAQRLVRRHPWALLLRWRVPTLSLHTVARQLYGNACSLSSLRTATSMIDVTIYFQNFFPQVEYLMQQNNTFVSRRLLFQRVFAVYPLPTITPTAGIGGSSMLTAMKKDVVNSSRANGCVIGIFSFCGNAYYCNRISVYAVAS